MAKKDTIRELFSSAFENQTIPVHPEVWKGIEAKMSSYRASGSSIAAKGLSLFIKMVIGSALVGIAAITAVLLIKRQNNKPITGQVVSEERVTKDNDTESLETANGRVYVDTPKVQKLKKKELQKKDTGSTSVIQTTEVSTQNSQTTDTQGSTQIIKQEQKEKQEEVTVVEPVKEEPVKETVANGKKASVVKLTKFPNVFTPNGDGKNDTYSVEIENIEEIKSFQVQIFDQNKKLVYKSSDPRFSWNGEYKDTVNVGSYACQITIIDKAGNTIKEKKRIKIRD